MTSNKKIVILASLGGMLELYDFAIYGMFAMYFARQFFPVSSHSAMLLESFSVFLLGFVLRPVGGIIFSHVGDEKGRKKVLVATIFIMGISSLAISLTPTYKTIGLMSPILLIFFRMLQGLALGGELPATFVYVEESIGLNKILAFGIVMAGIFGGFLLAALLSFIFTHVAFFKLNLSSYMWRVPFFIGGVICFISYKIRKTLMDTASFKKVHKKSKFPLLQVLHQFPVKVLFGVFLSAAQQTLSVVLIIFMPSYLNAFLSVPMHNISSLITSGVLVTIITIVLCGAVFNRFNNNKTSLLLFAIVFNIIIVPLSFILIVYHGYIESGYLLLMVAHGVAALLVPIYLAKLFPTRIRLTGVAVCYNISIIALAGIAPILITMLIKHGVGLMWSPTIYILVILIIATCGILFKQLEPFENKPSHY